MPITCTNSCISLSSLQFDIVSLFLPLLWGADGGEGWAALWEHWCEPNPPPITGMSPCVKIFRKNWLLWGLQTRFLGKIEASRVTSHPHIVLMSNKCSKILQLKTIPVLTWMYQNQTSASSAEIVTFYADQGAFPVSLCSLSAFLHSLQSASL